LVPSKIEVSVEICMVSESKAAFLFVIVFIIDQYYSGLSIGNVICLKI